MCYVWVAETNALPNKLQTSKTSRMRREAKHTHTRKKIQKKKESHKIWKPVPKYLSKTFLRFWGNFLPLDLMTCKDGAPAASRCHSPFLYSPIFLIPNNFSSFHFREKEIKSNKTRMLCTHKTHAHLLNWRFDGRSWSACEKKIYLENNNKSSGD